MNQASTPELDALLQHLTELLQSGAHSEAEILAARSRVQFPDDGELIRMHGLALLQLGRRTEAIEMLQHAATVAPHSIEVQCNLAAMQVEDGDADGAIERLRAALRRTPGHPTVLYGLGNALMAAARYTQARESFAMATHGAPAHPGLRLNLATVELVLGNVSKADVHVNEALQLAPRFDGAHALLGQVLHAQGRPMEAAKAWQHAGQLAPENPQHALHAGLMLDDSGQIGLAVEAYTHALQLDAASAPALSQLVFAKRRLCDWRELEKLADRLHRAVADDRPGIVPFAFLAEEASAAEQLHCASTFATQVDQKMAPLRRQLAFNHVTQAANAPIRVGFVSNSFGENATGLYVPALFEALQSSELDIHLFATAADDDDPTDQRLAAVASLHKLAGLTAAQTAERIHETGVEVLFDLRGHDVGSHAELLALRPAPVQVNWLHPGTSGAPWMDYVLADAVVLPATLREGHSEKLVRLPRCFQPYDNTHAIGTVPMRSECGLPESGTVFACFNNSYKINPAAFARFIVILRQVPDSVLWLRSGPEGADDRLRAAAAMLEIAPERLVFMPRLPRTDYLARYAHADLFLDTLPYNAHTTASDALWAGCPVLTCVGQTFAGRITASLLYHADLPELVTEDEEAFIAMATQLGTNHAALATVRQHLQQVRSSSPLLDMQGFANDFRRAVQAMGARHRIGRPPTDLDL
jgi:predicted O-linked N-acetylglucosamine transferase (SPINDLY family)